MVLADRIRLANTRQLLRAFGGLNETYGCSEAEYSAGVNFSTRDFPALSTRTPRRKLRALTGLNGMYHLNGLLTVCGRDITYTPDDAAAPAVAKLDAVTDGRKALVGIGTKILIFPDKLAFDTADGSVTALGALWTAAGKSVTFAPCDAAGKTYQVEAFGREEPAEPADGQLFLKVEDADHPWRYDSTLEMYSKNSGSWAAIPLEYCRITAAGLGKLFRQWDTVTVQGAAAEAAGQSPELNGDQIVYDVGEDWLRVRCTPQGEYFYGTLVQNAAAAQWQSMDGKQHRSVEAAQTVSMERRVPELDFVTGCGAATAGRTLSTAASWATPPTGSATGASPQTATPSPWVATEPLPGQPPAWAMHCFLRRTPCTSCTAPSLRIFSFPACAAGA